MKQLAGYIPLLAFFAVWAMDERQVRFAGVEHVVGGIYSAAEVLLVMSILVYGALWLAYRRLDKLEWITLASVVLFCIPTFLLRDVNFLKWKTPLVNGTFAALFLGSHYVGSKPIVQHLLGHAMTMPRESWLRLSKLWIGFFALLGLVNLAVAYGLSEAAWIRFKVFGNPLATVLFIAVQLPFFVRHMAPGDGTGEAAESGTGGEKP